MANPYFLVAYGHTVRISERCLSRTTAAKYCFGLVAHDRMTVMEVKGKGWGYRSDKEKRELMVKLARRHKEKTGETSGGLEKETADVVYKDPQQENYPGTEPKEGDRRCVHGNPWGGSCPYCDGYNRNYLGQNVVEVFASNPEQENTESDGTIEGEGWAEEKRCEADESMNEYNGAIEQLARYLLDRAKSVEAGNTLEARKRWVIDNLHEFNIIEDLEAEIKATTTR